MTATANVIMIIRASVEDIVSKLSLRSNRIYRERGVTDLSVSYIVEIDET